MCIRDSLYIDDAIQAFLLMGSSKAVQGQAVNFGTGKAWSINELAKKIIQLSGSSSKIIHIEERLAEVDRLICDYSKAKSLFGWEPKTSLEEGLKKNIEWARGRKE